VRSPLSDPHYRRVGPPPPDASQTTMNGLFRRMNCIRHVPLVWSMRVSLQVCSLQSHPRRRLDECTALTSSEQGTVYQKRGFPEAPVRDQSFAPRVADAAVGGAL
jgi:hypothetical protein